jgi:acyl dehydratase
MSATPLRLLDWKIPPVRQTYTRRDTAFYALSLGLGEAPTDSRHLALVNPGSAHLAALPSMALVLGYPGFWLGAPEVQEATGVAAWQILHVEQSVHLPRPLPVEAEVVGETTVTAILDKGADKGSLLYSERSIREARSSLLLARCAQVHYLRRAGGFGSQGAVPGDPPPWACDTPAPLHSRSQTLPQQALLYRLNGDTNALHIDPDVATQAGFARPILHGMCTAGIAVSAVIGVLAELDPRRVKSFSVRMSRPVLPGDTLHHEIWPNGAFRTRVGNAEDWALTQGRVDLT